MLRTARQIKVDKELLENKNVNVRIGTVENRNNPDTVYIDISFWVCPKDNTIGDPSFLRRKLSKELRDVYFDKVVGVLSNNRIFPKFDDNLYIPNIPENFNYNKKKNFVSIELYLHTLNINSKDKYPLNKNGDSIIFKECIGVVNSIITTKILTNESDFLIFNKK